MIKTRPSKSKTTSQLIKELDTVFSEFIRVRDADHKGTVTCFVTGEKVFWNDGCDAAHFCNRQHMSTRWDEMNVHACTATSNRYDTDHLAIYGRNMISKYGPDAFHALLDRRRALTKFTAFELQEKIDHYREEVKKAQGFKEDMKSDIMPIRT